MKGKTPKRSLGLLLFIICVTFVTHGQDPSASVVVSPSPSSSVIARYSEVPVNPSTGIPEISVPLYVIESSQLTYPISLSYHASGIKVEDVAGPVGTGWSLNAGGMINRIMRDRPDEQENGFFSFASAIPNETDALSIYTKNDLAKRITDMIPDLFYYSTGTMAGKMIFDNQLVPRSIPQNILKISVSSTSSLTSFTFADASGNNFEFEPGETATVAYLGIPTAGATYISSWYLTRIISADKTDTIKFNYTSTGSLSYTTSINSGLNLFYDVPQGASKNPYEITPINSRVEATVTGTRYLSSIVHKNGKVAFTFSGNRTDDPDAKKLDLITIYDKDPVLGTYVENKRILFSYSYFQNTDEGTRLRLDSFRERLDPVTFNPPYTFTYSIKQLPSTLSHAQDHWGYYNGADANTSLIPAYTHQPGNLVISTNNREVNPDFVDGCMIRSIISPLGGITEFEFESNIYLKGTEDTYGPGLRISKITKRDPFSNVAAITNYDYSNPLDGKSSGRLMNKPDYFTELDVFDNVHVGGYDYSCLLIKTHATSIGNFSGAPVIYEYVTTYANDDPSYAGKTVSKFSMYSAPTIAYPYFPVEDNSWTAGDLLMQEVYGYENGTLKPIRRIENVYDVSPYSFTIKGLSSAYSRILFFATAGADDFITKNYFTSSKFKYLKESRVYDYEQASGTTNTLTTTKYFYEKTNIHLFPTKTEVTTSLSSEAVKREFTYVADGPSTGVNGTMQNLNMTSLPLETMTFLVRNGTDYIIDYSKTEYFEWSANKIYPKNFYGSKIQSGLLRSAFELSPTSYTRLASRINSYSDGGIPLETEIIGDRPKSAIVDSKFNRVVASTSGAAANQIAYTSFESKDFGNWNVTTGTTSTPAQIELSNGYPFEPFYLHDTQVLTYEWEVVQSHGPGMQLTFTQDGTTPVMKYLSGSSGSGSVTLTAGAWLVTLTYDELFVTSASVGVSFLEVSQNDPAIVSSTFKTGQRALQFGASQTVYRDGLPNGTYTIMFYQKGGTATVTTTGGASVLNTVISNVEADGWSKVQKEVSISGPSQRIEISGTDAIFIDELRLHPAGSFMTTTCYDTYKQSITQTDVNARSQFTEYDEWRRMKVLRDHDRNILQHYDYKFAIH